MSNLITIEEYKAFTSKTKTDDDPKLNVIIPAVSNAIKAYLGSTTPEDPTAEIEEYIYLDYETDRFYTKYWPIREIISIEETRVYTYDSTIHVPLTSGADFFLANDAIIRYPTSPYGFAGWPMSPGVIKIVYKAGTLDDNGDPISTPMDIKLAAIELTSYYLKQEYIQNKSIMGSSISTYVDKIGMPPHIARLLENYKSTF